MDGESATRIAAFYRGEKVRQEVRQMKKATLSVQRLWRRRHRPESTSAIIKNEEDRTLSNNHSRAATKIAAIYRGVRVRSTVNELKKAALSVQRMWRSKKSERPSKSEETQDGKLVKLLLEYVELQNQHAVAAARIQRWFRQQHNFSKEEESVPEEGEHEEIRVLLEEHGALSAAKSTAASKIQRLFRNRLAWKKEAASGDADAVALHDKDENGDEIDNKDEEEERIDKLYRLHQQLREEDVMELAVLQQECLIGEVDLDIRILVTESLSKAATSIQRAYRRTKKRRVFFDSSNIDSAGEDVCGSASCNESAPVTAQRGVAPTRSRREATMSTDVESTTDSDSGCDCACVETVCDHLWAAVKIQAAYRELKRKRRNLSTVDIFPVLPVPPQSGSPLFAAARLVQAGLRARHDRERYLLLRKSVLRLQKQLRTAPPQTSGPKQLQSEQAAFSCGVSAISETCFSEARRECLRTKSRIYIVPVSLVPVAASPIASVDETNLDLLSMFTTLFFFRRTVVALPIEIQRASVCTRHHPTQGHTQVLGTDLLAALSAAGYPDAIGCLGVSADDLFPIPNEDKISHVAGLASCVLGVGAVTFARFDPAFYGVRRTLDHRPLFFRRSAMVTVHELCHVFGLGHCEGECLMRETSTLQEADERPLRLCPPCLLLLRNVLKFDEAARASELSLFFQSIGFYEEVKWLRKDLGQK